MIGEGSPDVKLKNFAELDRLRAGILVLRKGNR